MNYFLALTPILLVIILMLFFRRGSQQAGPAGWLAGLLIAWLFFGLNWNVLWVSQVKGLLLSLNVLLILWAALFLYNLVDQTGGVKAVARALETRIADAGWLQILLAWVLAALIESLAGFGLPMAIVAPMLMGLGVPVVEAVAAAAIGHAWAVSLGNMGVVIQILTSVTQIDERLLLPAASLLLGIACVATGLAAAMVLKQLKHWKRIILLGSVMGSVQAAAALSGLTPLAAFIAALVGILLGLRLAGRRVPASGASTEASLGLQGAAAGYGSLVALMTTTSLIPIFRQTLSSIVWKMDFPQVATTLGVATAAGPGQVFRPLMHPAFLILVSAGLATIYLGSRQVDTKSIWSASARATLCSAGPASIGVLSMVGLSTVMEHTGMSMLLAQGLVLITGPVFPLVSPLVGMLGAFATGSNSNSNVLFGTMQKNIAAALGINPATLLAAQTAGGSLGGMIAPAKLAVGCSTTGLKNQEGLVLRKTLPAGISIGLLLGVVTWLIGKQ